MLMGFKTFQSSHIVEKGRIIQRIFFFFVTKYRSVSLRNQEYIYIKSVAFEINNALNVIIFNIFKILIS